MMQDVFDLPLFESNTDIETMRTRHPISWHNKVNIVAKTLLEVILCGLVLTPRKLDKM